MNEGARRTVDGMTLVEVLLALVILASGLSALIIGTSRSLGVVRQAKDYETARRLLTQLEADLPLDPDGGEHVEEGDREGDFEDTPGFRWRRDIRRIGEPEDGLFEMTTTLQWGDGGRSSRETLTTWLYAPDSAEP